MNAEEKEFLELLTLMAALKPFVDLRDAERASLNALWARLWERAKDRAADLTR